MSRDEVLEKLKKAESNFIKSGLLHFKENINHSVSLSEFIYVLIDDYFRLYYTLDDKDEITCAPAKNRSIEDIYRTTKYYYDCTLEDMLACIYLQVLDNKLNTLRCPDIQKIVFWIPDSRVYSSTYNTLSYLSDISLEIQQKELESYFNKEYCQQKQQQ